MKQTAVEWFAENIKGHISEGIRNEVCKQAKAMEKEQIMDAYWQGDAESDNINVDAEDYYNETFKSE